MLKTIFPAHDTDYDVFLQFYKVRNIVYEWMFFLFFVLCFRVGDRIVKAICAMGVILVGGSLVDKAIFNISDYLISDFILGLIALMSGYKVYKENE